MRALIEVPVTLIAVTPRAEKEGKAWSDTKAATLTFAANWEGANVSQLFPSVELWQALAAALFNDDGSIRLRTGTISLEDEIHGGIVTLRAPLWAQPMKWEGADVKSVNISPSDGRMCAVRFAVNVRPEGEQWEHLVEMLKRDLALSATQAGQAPRQDPAQTSMPLPPGGEAAVPEGVPPELAAAILGASGSAPEAPTDAEAQEGHPGADDAAPPSAAVPGEAIEARPRSPDGLVGRDPADVIAEIRADEAAERALVEMAAEDAKLDQIPVEDSRRPVEPDQPSIADALAVRAVPKPPQRRKSARHVEAATH